jgi:hypothetical protein
MNPAENASPQPVVAETTTFPFACGELGETWVGFAAEDRVCGDSLD